MQFLEDDPGNVVREEIGGDDSNDEEWHKLEDDIGLAFADLKKEDSAFERQSTFRKKHGALVKKQACR